MYVRTHNLLTTGDGTAALKWGSTNAYSEDASGTPHYDWTIVDRIFDTLVERKMAPLVEIGFMPKALSAKPEPYQHTFPQGSLWTGWAQPPRDYAKWGELVHQWARHAVEKYGRVEVERWYWEVWNEPDIGYWQGTPEEYQKLYDFAADAGRALPSARIGGPHVTGPNAARSQQFLRAFLEHCCVNYATGTTGSPLDYVGFHAKGAPRVPATCRWVSNQLRAIANGFRSSLRPSCTTRRSSSAIPKAAACSMKTGERTATARCIRATRGRLARTYELADLFTVNLRGAVTWAFEFEGQPYFDGFRDLATNGIDKPVLNVFRMLGRMSGRRVAVTSAGALPVASVRDAGVRGAPDIAALASRDDRAVSVLLWNYHDDDLAAAPAEIDLIVDGLDAPRATLTHDRIDATHSNAYEAWKRMGAPQPPTRAQYAELERAGQLQALEPPRQVDAAGGQVRVAFALPRQAVSLVRLTW